MKNKGFTLIEVLIVVIIIGILATLMVPQISGMAERARTAEAKNILGAMRTALMVYYMEHEGTTTAGFPSGAANIGSIENMIGDVVDDAKSLFTYAWTSGQGANTITVTATRDTSKSFPSGSKQSKVVMTVNAGGSADMIVSWL